MRWPKDCIRARYAVSTRGLTPSTSNHTTRARRGSDLHDGEEGVEAAVREVLHGSPGSPRAATAASSRRAVHSSYTASSRSSVESNCS